MNYKFYLDEQVDKLKIFFHIKNQHLFELFSRLWLKEDNLRARQIFLKYASIKFILHMKKKTVKFFDINHIQLRLKIKIGNFINKHLPRAISSFLFNNCSQLIIIQLVLYIIKLNENYLIISSNDMAIRHKKYPLEI